MAELLIRVYDSAKGLVGKTLKNPNQEVGLGNLRQEAVKIRAFMDQPISYELLAERVKGEFVQMGFAQFDRTPENDDILEVKLDSQEGDGYYYVYYNSFKKRKI